MGESDDLPSAGSEFVVEREETYTHDEHGSVTVTAIWKGIKEVDTTQTANEKDTYIVRYSANEDGEPVDELTDTLSEFVESVDESK